MAALQKEVAVARSRMADADTRMATRAEFRAELKSTIEALDLSRNVADLDMQGYTVIRDAAPLAFFETLRATILEMSRARKKAGTSGDRRGVFSDTIQDVVAKGRIFEDAVLNPKLNALMTYLLGDGHVINAAHAVVVEQGGPALFVHTDLAYIPDPFPIQPQVATAVWVTEDLDAPHGASRVVPGTHRLLRHPNPGEGEEDAIAIDCPAGSIVMWNGATWHGNCGRAAPGERVTLHTSFCRMHVRPFAANQLIPQEVIDRNPPLLAQLLGRGLPYGNEGETGPNPELRAHAARLFARRL